MIINIPTTSKATEIKPVSYSVEVMVELEDNEFRRFCKNPLDYYDFISENKDKLEYNNPHTDPCILVVNKETGDGVAVDPQGYDYARYSAFVPHARELYTLSQYPVLKEFMDQMKRMVDRFVQKAIDGQTDGIAYIDVDEETNNINSEFFDIEVYKEMITERKEFLEAEIDNCDAKVKLADEFVNVSYGEKLRKMTQDEVEIALAKHMLWLHDIGGEQADFSNCYLENINFAERDMTNIVFNNSAFRNCSFWKSVLNFSEGTNAEFHSCDMYGVKMDECKLTGSEFGLCQMTKSSFIHSDLDSARFDECDVTMAGFSNALISNLTLDGTDFKKADIDDSYKNRDEWLDDASGLTEQI